MSKWRSFKEAKKFARSLKLKNLGDWRTYCTSGKKPKDIPSRPDVKYKEWISYPDFLGTVTMSYKNHQFWPFLESRDYVRKLHLSGVTEWKKFSTSKKRPIQLPSAPDQHYKKQGTWTNWADFLGTDNVAFNQIKYRNFKHARIFAHSLKLKNTTEWRKYCKSGQRPKDIPSNPDKRYKGKGWIGFGDWLGTRNISTQKKSMQYLSPSEALPIFRKLAIEYGLKNKEDWKKFAKTYENLLEKLRIPAYPLQVYSKENVWRKMKN